MYLLGYIPKDDRLYLGDKELNIVSYSLLVSVLEYQTAVMRRDFGMADKVLPTIPKEQRTRVAHFLEKQVRKTKVILFINGVGYYFSRYKRKQIVHQHADVVFFSLCLSRVSNSRRWLCPQIQSIALSWHCSWES